jgi:cytidine deaminase
MLDEAVRQRLSEGARRAREGAYAPYSGFRVGAAVLTARGEIFTGANVENASFGATVCAERVAIFAAVAAGRRDLTALAVMADTPEPVAPCGLCRQVLAEFNPDCEVVLANTAGGWRLANLKELLPLAFGLPGEGGGGPGRGLSKEKKHDRT